MEGEAYPLLKGNKILSFWDKFGYSLGHVQNDFFAGMWFTYSLVFFQLAAGPNTIIAGIFILIGQLTDAIATPLAGYLLDCTNNKKKWHICGSIVTSTSFSLMFTFCQICMSQQMWIVLYYSIAIMVFQGGWAFVQISHLSILPELSPCQKDRAELTSYRYSASMIANIILYFITWGYFASSSSKETTLLGPDDYGRFFNIAITITILGLVSTLMFQYLTKHRKLSRQLLQLNEHFNWRSPETIKNICCSTDIYIIAAVYTSSRVFLNITMGYMQLYLNESMITLKESIAIIPLAMFSSSAITSLLYKNCFSNIGGFKLVYFLGWLASLGGCTVIYTRNENSDSITVVLISAVLFGIGSALALVVSLSLAANLVSKQGTEAFIYSSVTFADKAVNGLIVVAIEYLKCTDDKDFCVYYYRNVLVYVNACLITIGLFFIILLPKQFLKR